MKKTPPRLDSECADVARFSLRFGIPIQTTPNLVEQRLLLQRFAHLMEELREFARASDGRDLAGMADALIDLVYVAKGIALMLGLPWAPLWNEVQRANMEKVPMKTERHDHDVVKPDGWKGPDIEGVLRAWGYAPTKNGDPA